LSVIEGSKYLRTPGRAIRAEHCIGARECASAQFVHSERAGKLRKGESAEIDATERSNIAGKISLVGGALRPAATNPPPAGSPGAELIGALDHGGAVGGIATRRQCRSDIDQPDPQAFAHQEVQPARVRE